ncbi:hypothetical protein V6N13_113443 [Hibiscus sabdariffa]|uniref:Uncharacterized protein n=1 Tax=Hibiscus sabdariffa TaxID=183260 RepID=A0ABR2CX69_9ROSI
MSLFPIPNLTATCFSIYPIFLPLRSIYLFIIIGYSILTFLLTGLLSIFSINPSISPFHSIQHFSHFPDFFFFSKKIKPWVSFKFNPFCLLSGISL